MRPTKLLVTAFAGASLVLAQAAGSGGGMAQGAGAQQTQPNQMGRMDPSMDPNVQSHVDDRQFVKDAALGGITEVELGKLAQQKADNPDVKQFAQRMVDDHTKTGDQLKQVAAKRNIEVPSSLDSRHQARIDKLSKLSGPQFDKAYVKDQLKDHEADVREFTAESQSGTDPNVKAFASSTLPTLQQHLELVKNLNKTEKQTSK